VTLKENAENALVVIVDRCDIRVLLCILTVNIAKNLVHYSTSIIDGSGK